MKTCRNLIATLMLSIPLICMAQGNSSQKPEKEIATVRYCDLLRDPAKYDKMTVRLTALYTRGFEISALDDPKCDSQKSTWVEFDPASRQCTKRNIQEEFDNVFYPPRKKRKGVIERPGPERAELMMVGQFNGPKPGIAIGPEGKRVLTGYGHLGGFDYQFIIKCIEAVRPGPWK